MLTSSPLSFSKIDLRPSRICNLVNSPQLVFITCKCVTWNESPVAPKYHWKKCISVQTFIYHLVIFLCNIAMMGITWRARTQWRVSVCVLDMDTWRWVPERLSPVRMTRHIQDISLSSLSMAVVSIFTQRSNIITGWAHCVTPGPIRMLLSLIISVQTPASPICHYVDTYWPPDQDHDKW